MPGWKSLLGLTPATLVLFCALLLWPTPAIVLGRWTGGDEVNGGEAYAVAALILLIPIAALVVGIALRAIFFASRR
jgi:hypothetical protein